MWVIICGLRMKSVWALGTDMGYNIIPVPPLISRVISLRASVFSSIKWGSHFRIVEHLHKTMHTKLSTAPGPNQTLQRLSPLEIRFSHLV